MPNMRHLADVMAIGLGEKPEAMTWVLRVLSRNRLTSQSKGGRGRRTEVTPRDAAVALLGAAAIVGTEAPDLVRAMGDLPFWRTEVASFSFEGSGNAATDEAPEILQGSVLDVLERLLTSDDSVADSLASLSVTTGPVPFVELTFKVQYGQPGSLVHSSAYYVAPEFRSWQGIAAFAEGPRRNVKVTLPWPTLPLIRAMFARPYTDRELDQLIAVEAERWADGFDRTAMFLDGVLLDAAG